MEILEKIINPSEEFTPVPFWFFNDAPDEKRIETQLRDYVEKGVNAVVLHPRIGVPENVRYLSEEYFAAVRFIVKTAASLNMKIVLYDEGMYPSGSAHGGVVESDPEFASKGIMLAGKDSAIPGSAEIIAALPGERYIVYGFTNGTIRGIHYGEDDQEPGAPKSADILNPDAVDEFIRLTHDRYYEELKEYFGSTVIAFFTDEPCALGRNAGSFREWVPGMEKELCDAGGKVEELEGLFCGQKNATTALYHRLIKKHLRETFYARLSSWCENHGIALMGHPEASDDIEEELYFHIPGQDLILRRVSPESGGLLEFDSVQAKLSADIARHLGRRRNANECFGVCCRDNIPWYFTGSDMKWYLDWLGIRGVNLFVPHAFYYSVEGRRKEERPPDVGPNNIWWHHYRKVSDYMKRLSYLMTDSRNGAKAAVLCDNNQVPYGEIACLYENQVEFNYLPVALLKEAAVENGRLCVGGYRYEAVLNLGFEGMEKTAGVQVVSDVQELIKDGGLRTVLLKAPCKNLRVSELNKTWDISGQEERFVRMYLFSNEGGETISTHATLPIQGKGQTELVLVDLWRGEAWRLPRQTKEARQEESRQRRDCRQGIEFDLKLHARETLLVILDEDGSIARKVKERQTELFLGDFTERFVQKETAGNNAVYTMNYQVSAVNGGEAFLARGEEMAECFCNGRFVDASFWGPHRFRIGPFLKEGDNEIKLVMTGNAANIYENAQIPFGLEK